MKLYTRTGDDGTTGLFGGPRVRKDHPRIEAYGTVDELNSAIGLAIAAIDPTGKPHLTSGIPGAARKMGVDFQTISSILKELQSRLFDLGADLATPHDSPHAAKVARLTAADVVQAERWIDEIDGGNDPMKTFVMPGGTELAARLHVARTICRRAERLMIALAANEPVTNDAIIYINRISDLLFAMARLANKLAGIADVPWVPRRPTV